MQLTVRQPSASEDAKHYTTDRLRSEYLIETVFAPDDAILTYSHFDRIIAGGVMPRQPRAWSWSAARSWLPTRSSSAARWA